MLNQGDGRKQAPDAAKSVSGGAFKIPPNKATLNQELAAITSEMEGIRHQAIENLGLLAFEAKDTEPSIAHSAVIALKGVARGEGYQGSSKGQYDRGDQLAAIQALGVTKHSMAGEFLRELTQYEENDWWDQANYGQGSGDSHCGSGFTYINFRGELAKTVGEGITAYQVGTPTGATTKLSSGFSTRHLGDREVKVILEKALSQF